MRSLIHRLWSSFIQSCQTIETHADRKVIQDLTAQLDESTARLNESTKQLLKSTAHNLRLWKENERMQEVNREMQGRCLSPDQIKFFNKLTANQPSGPEEIRQLQAQVVHLQNRLSQVDA